MVKWNCIGEKMEFRVGKVILWMIRNEATILKPRVIFVILKTTVRVWYSDLSSYRCNPTLGDSEGRWRHMRTTKMVTLVATVGDGSCSIKITCYGLSI